MSFRLVPKLVTLNDLERHNGRYFLLFQRIRVGSGRTAWKFTFAVSSRDEFLFQHGTTAVLSAEQWGGGDGGDWLCGAYVRDVVHSLHAEVAVTDAVRQLRVRHWVNVGRHHCNIIIHTLIIILLTPTQHSNTTNTPTAHHVTVQWGIPTTGNPAVGQSSMYGAGSRMYTRYNRLSNRFHNRFDNRLYRVNGA